MTILGHNQNYHIILGNNRDYYGAIGNVDAIITDPPYGAEVHADHRRTRDSGGRVAVEAIPFAVLSDDDIGGLTEFAAERCQGWLLAFTQPELLLEWRDKAIGNFIRYVTPMYWVKTNAKPNFSGQGPGVGVEAIATFWCPEKPQGWNGGGKVGTFHYPKVARIASGETRHPTAKPVPLMKELVRLFSNPGDIIFDPFMGCAATGVAALELGRRFVGIEAHPDYFREAGRRLASAILPDPAMVMIHARMPTLTGGPEFPSRKNGARQPLPD
jgi:site-specific DNA-methyltransferase (adenine-specific)